MGFELLLAGFFPQEAFPCLAPNNLCDLIVLGLVVPKPSKRAKVDENEKAVKSCCAHPDSHLLRQTDCVALYLGHY